MAAIIASLRHAAEQDNSLNIRLVELNKMVEGDVAYKRHVRSIFTQRRIDETAKHFAIVDDLIDFIEDPFLLAIADELGHMRNI